MNALQRLQPVPVLIEVTTHRLVAWHRGALGEWSLERTATGSLTEGCRQRLQAELVRFVDHKPGNPAFTPGVPSGRGACRFGDSAFRGRAATSSGGWFFWRLRASFPSPRRPWPGATSCCPHRTAFRVPPPRRCSSPPSERRSWRKTRTLLTSCTSCLVHLAGVVRGLVPADFRERHGLLNVGQQSSELVVWDAQGPADIRWFPWGAGSTGGTLPCAEPGAGSTPSAGLLPDAGSTETPAVARGGVGRPAGR